MFEVREVISKRLILPADHATANAIGQIVACVINAELNVPGTLDRVIAGGPIPSWARDLAVAASGDVPGILSLDQTVASVLADIRIVLGGAESQKEPE